SRTSIPLARQSYCDNDANAATSDSHPDCRSLPIQIAALHIVIDTLNRCFGGGDENSTKDMSAFVKGCDAMREEFGASVLIIHHTGHDAGKGARGATALPSAMDIAFVLTKPKGSSLAILKNEDPAKPHKDSAPLPDQALEFVEVEIDELEPNEDDP